MKWVYITLTVIFFFVFSGGASAQRYLPGMYGIQVTIGAVPKNGSHYGIAFSQYTKNSGRYTFGVEYLDKRHPYKSIKIPQSIFVLDAGYFLKFLSDYSKTVFFSFGASGHAGYETINWNNKVLFDGATIINGDSFIYGGSLTLESEIYLTDRIILLCNIREKLLMGSSVGKFHTQAGLGLKFIIN